MHLVGFIIRIYHDARSSECQKNISCVLKDTLCTIYCVDYLNYGGSHISKYCKLTDNELR